MEGEDDLRMNGMDVGGFTMKLRDGTRSALHYPPLQAAACCGLARSMSGCADFEDLLVYVGFNFPICVGSNPRFQAPLI